MRLGSHHTVETKAKTSSSQMGHKASPEACVKMSASHMGLPFYGLKHQSLETRTKMSASRMGHPASNWKGGKIEATRRSLMKRRALGFNPLNSWFPGSDGHHINDHDVIYMLHKLHNSISHNVFTGRNMDKINILAGQYLTEDWT